MSAEISEICEYAWGLNMGGGIGGLLNLKQGGQNYAYLYDGKGNVSAILDGSQAVAATYTYDAFGTLMSETGSLSQPFKFSTKLYDPETGLSYFGYRFYSPTLGRWMTRDPIGLKGGLNLYGFVWDNPVNWVDPYGLKIVVLGGTTKYKQAIEYLSRDPGMAAIIHDLESSSTTYTVILNNNDDNSYNWDTNEIYWDAHSGLKCLGTDKRGSQAPALGLGHEMAHADAPWYYRLILRGIWIKDYDDLEEKRVISGPEADAARTLGETIRTNHHYHWTNYFWAETPTTRWLPRQSR